MAARRLRAPRCAPARASDCNQRMDGRVILIGQLFHAVVREHVLSAPACAPVMGKLGNSSGRQSASGQRLHPTQGLRSGRREIRITPKSLSLSRASPSVPVRSSARKSSSGSCGRNRPSMQRSLPVSRSCESVARRCAHTAFHRNHSSPRLQIYRTDRRPCGRCARPAAGASCVGRDALCSSAGRLSKRVQAPTAGVGTRRGRRRQDDADGGIPAAAFSADRCTIARAECVQHYGAGRNTSRCSKD